MMSLPGAFAMACLVAIARAVDECESSCPPGYKLPAAGTVAGPRECTECAQGYTKVGKLCTNGKAGSPCVASAEYPHKGCSFKGTQIGTCSGGNVFPCVCEGDDCGRKIQDLVAPSGECFPAGPKMHTTYPNSPSLGNPFAVTVVGCGLKEDERYAMIPAFTEDASAEMRCDSLQGPEGGIPAKCRFDAKDLDNTEVVVSAGANGTDCPQLLLTNLLLSEPRADNTVEASFPGLRMDQYPTHTADGATYTYTEGGEEKVEPQPESFFKLCALRGTGADEYWTDVQSHHEQTNNRDARFRVVREAGVQGAPEGGGEGCCEGLRIGSLCLPLWAFILLWLLMACCLGALGFALRKNNKEIEAQKNNERYEKFGTDNEMIDYAKERDEDDDI